MDILALVCIVLSIKRKNRRCLYAAIVTFATALVFGLFGLPTLAGTAALEVLSVLNNILLVLFPLTLVLAFARRNELEKRYALPVIFGAAYTALALFRKIYYQIQYTQGLNTDEFVDHFYKTTFVLSIIDAICAWCIAGVGICIIWILFKRKPETVS